MIATAKVTKKVSSTLGFYIRGIYRKMLDEDVILFGSAIAFNTILCIIPLLLLLTALVGMFLNSSQEAFQHINDLLNTAFPDQPYATKIKLSLQGIVSDIILHRRSFGWMSILTLMWTATFLFGASRNVLNRIFNFKSKKLFIIGIIENVFAVVVVVILFMLANIVFVFSSVIGELVRKQPELKDIISTEMLRTIPIILTISLIMVMFYIIYQFMPDRRIPVKSAIMATLSTTVLWIFAGKAFELYLVRFATFKQLYGTYTFMLVFLLWIEYSSIIFIVGAIVGQLHRERHYPSDSSFVNKMTKPGN